MVADDCEENEQEENDSEKSINDDEWFFTHTFFSNFVTDPCSPMPDYGYNTHSLSSSDYREEVFSPPEVL